MDVEVVLTTGDEVVIKHSYYDDDKFTYDFDYTEHTITLTNDLDNAQFFLNFMDIITLVTENYAVRIEIPNTLVLENITIHSTNGEITIRNVDAGTVEIQTTNSEITLTNMNIDDDITAHSTNGSILVKDINVSGYGVLDLVLTNGNIDYYNDDETYMPDRLELDKTNGNISTNVR